MPNKLDEINRPKMTKDEAKVLVRLVLRRFGEIIEKYMRMCESRGFGGYCGACCYRHSCDFIDWAYDGMDSVVNKVSVALNVPIFFSWEEESIRIVVHDIKPDEGDDKSISSYDLIVEVVVDNMELKDEDFYFEPVTVRDERVAWRCVNERIIRYGLWDVLPYFFRGEGV